MLKRQRLLGDSPKKIRTKKAAPLSVAVRLAIAFGSMMPLGVLAFASTLEPATHGTGTHRQLGLPPCWLQAEFGMRCPSCGMTTSWAYFSRGQVLQSVEANAAGFVLALLAIAVPIMTWDPVVRGRRWTRRQWQRAVAIAALVPAVTLAHWIACVLTGR